MREIKFRAWDKNTELAVAWDELMSLCESKEIAGVAKFNVKLFERYAPDNLMYVTTYRGNPFKMDNFILMQYTGLKDKNGTEIYEGDIVRLAYLSPKDPEIEQLNTGISQIVFKWGQWTFEHISGATPSRGTLWKVHDDMETESGEDWGDAIYVIGNIYENKDLLA